MSHLIASPSFRNRQDGSVLAYKQIYPGFKHSLRLAGSRISASPRRVPDRNKRHLIQQTRTDCASPTSRFDACFAQHTRDFRCHLPLWQAHNLKFGAATMQIRPLLEFQLDYRKFKLLRIFSLKLSRSGRFAVKYYRAMLYLPQESRISADIFRIIPVTYIHSKYIIWCQKNYN